CWSGAERVWAWALRWLLSPLPLRNGTRGAAAHWMRSILSERIPSDENSRLWLSFRARSSAGSCHAAGRGGADHLVRLPRTARRWGSHLRHEQDPRAEECGPDRSRLIGERLPR